MDEAKRENTGYDPHFNYRPQNTPKSKKFAITYKANGKTGLIKRGAVVDISGKPHTIERIEKVELKNGVLRIEGKCKITNDK